MVFDIKMCRFDNVPWGFRLVGGSDFEYPLTVVKVTEGSIAEEAGLMIGDVIVRINDTATSPLTHDETNKLIKSCGNVFYFGVYRENEDELNAPKQFPVGQTYSASPVDSYRDDVNKSPQSEVAEQCNADEAIEAACEKQSSPMPTLNTEQPIVVVAVASNAPEEAKPQECLLATDGRPCSVLSENSEIKIVEEEIAAVLSGESEVLQEHNVMGIFPKPGVCMSSDVLRSLNEEAIKTKAEKDKENKKWSTFLQKPNRPIPKSKAQLEAERHAANAYKVKIVKSAPIDRERTPPPPPSPKPSEPVVEAKQPTPPKEKTPEEVAEEQPLPTDNEVPNLLEVNMAEQQPGDEAPNNVDTDVDNEMEKSDEEKAITNADTSNAEEQGDQEQSDASTPTSTAAESNEPEVPAKTEEELALERQLADVQRQLAALSNLPSTIQSTLDAVTKQLAELLPAFKLQQQVKTESAPREISLEKIDEQEASETNAEDNAESNTKKEENEIEQQNGESEGMEKQQQDLNDDMEVASFDNKRSEQQPKRQFHEEQHAEEEQENEGDNLKKQKKYDVIEELEEHLERKNNRTKRSKRAFGPLTPSSERPLVLPGGRRWYRPKDAYNDEFIAETLSAQAELITGTTLGCTFESPLLGYDPSEYHSACVGQQLQNQRVNFMKYQKPERRIDLNRSEVYKIIHHLDRQPVRGIEVRPPVVPAEVDVRKAVHS